LNIFEILPPEILVIIFGHLQPADIVASLFVSKLWNAFHSGFNWKEAYMATFGEVSESAVDLSQKFNWRKLFFDRQKMVRLSRRKLKLKSLARTNANRNSLIRISLVTTDHLVYMHSKKIGEYSEGADVFVADLRVLKENPGAAREKLITQQSGLSALPASYWRYEKVKGTSGVLTVPFTKSTASRSISDPDIIWNIKKGSKIVPTIVLGYSGFLTLNSKYLIWNNCPKYELLDLSKKCYHYCDMERQGQTYVRDCFPQPCPEGKCVIIETWKDSYWNSYLSQQDPDLLVGIRVNDDDYFELVLYRIGHAKTTVSIAKVATERARRQVQIGSENVIRQKAKGKIIQHWFSFEVNGELYFIDLNNTSHKIKMPKVSNYKWLPNEHKVALANKEMLIVFDLENVSRCSKTVFKTHIRDFAIFPSNGLIAVLEKETLTLCQWATATKSRVIDLTNYDVSFVDVISEDLLLVHGNTDAFYTTL
jgi:hypothetical protein